MGGCYIDTLSLFKSVLYAWEEHPVLLSMRIGNSMCFCLTSHPCHSCSSLPFPPSLPSLGIKRVMRHIVFFFVFSQHKPSGCIFRIFCIKISPRTDPTGQKEAEIFNLFFDDIAMISCKCRDSDVEAIDGQETFARRAWAGRCFFKRLLSIMNGMKNIAIETICKGNVLWVVVKTITIKTISTSL